MSERRFDRRTLLKAGAAAFLTGGTILRGQGGNPGTGSGPGAELVQVGSAENSSKRNLPMISFDGPSDQLPPPVYKKPHVSIAEENAKEGHTGWQLTRPDISSVAAFAAPNSVAAGEKLNFHVATASGRHSLRVFRLGWYGGRGGCLVYEQDDINSPRIGTRVEGNTRTVVASWEASHSVTVPDDWRSGVYAAVATGTNGSQCIAPFWVRSQEKTAPVIASSGLLTSAAYNNWSLSTYGGAAAVGLDRPNRARGGIGEVLPWDMAFLRWLERSGVDADYMADVDSHDHEDIYEGRGLIVLMGHHEYYTAQMRQRIEKAVTGDGVNLAVFGANALYWRVRLENSAFGDNRIMVAYRSGLDPDSSNPTGEYRKLGNPEAKLLGVAYEQTSAGDDWVVSNPNHWVFEDTEVKKGDAFKKLIGPEYDSIFEGIPTGSREILAESVINPGPKQGHSYSCLVTHDSGARVFTTGSLDWVFGLDGYRLGHARDYPIAEDPRAQKIASNVLRRLSNKND